MTNTDLEGVIRLINACPYPYFYVRSNKSDVNSTIYRTDDDLDKAANIEAFRRTMAEVDGEYFVVVLKQNAKDNTGNYTYTFHNRLSAQRAATPAAPAVAGISDDELNRRLELERRSILAEYQAKDLERRERELAAARREFNAEKSSTIGIIVDRLGKVIPQLFPRVAVAGTPDNQLPTPGTDDIPVVHTSPAPTQRSDDFSPHPTTPETPDPETAHLEDLLTRLADAEPDYLRLLETIVLMAERQDPTYTMARSFLLK